MNKNDIDNVNESLPFLTINSNEERGSRLSAKQMEEKEP
jgi:hypothetical protein